MTGLWRALDDAQHIYIILGVTLISGLFIAASGVVGMWRAEHWGRAEDARPRVEEVGDAEWAAIRHLDRGWSE